MLMPFVSMSVSVDVRVASYIANKYGDTREQSAFINKVLLDHIRSLSLTPKRIDTEIESIRVKAKTEIQDLLNKKKELIKSR